MHAEQHSQAECSRVDVVGVGLNATDTLIFVPQLPGSGSKVEVGSTVFSPGGQVASAMIACRQWGLRTRYVGKLGDDPAADVHHQDFAHAGVEARIIAVPGCPSAHSYIVVDGRGERTVLWQRDARLKMTPAEIDRNWITSARALLVDGADTAAAIQAADWASEAGVPVIADLDEPYSGIEKLLEKTDYLIVSRDLPARISGQSDLRESLEWLHCRFNCRITGATLGVEGVLAYDGSSFHHVPAYQVSAVDTTGAGDIFHAGFIYGLLRNWPLQRILEFGCAAAALNCTAVGARGGIRPIQEIEALMSRGEKYPRSRFAESRATREKL